MNSQFARKKVKVVLSGDGADEVFGGYGRYKSWQLLQKMRFLKSAFPQLVDGAYKKFFKKIPIQNLQKLFTYHLHPLVEGLRRNSPGSQYLSYIEKISLEERMKFFDLEKTARFHETQYETFFRYKLRQAPTEDILRFIFSFDLQTSLVDEMLTKVDRASMLNGLELRVPFLDHRIVEYALSLAPETKIKNKGKDILRKTFRREVPSFVLRAAKRGFNVPIDHWIKRELHHSFREIFRSDVVEELGLRKEYLLQDFDRYLQQKTATTGVKYFYFYIFLKWYANFKRNRAFECPYASSS